MAVRFRVLGPVEVANDGVVLPICRPRDRAVLALLLLDADRVVGVPAITGALWGCAPPASARTQVQVSVSRLRSALRPAGLDELLSTRPGGYRLAARGHLDLTDFEGLTRKARKCLGEAAYPQAATLLRQALGLWRGPALAGAAGCFVEPAVAALTERHLAAHELLAEVELTLGRCASVVEGLTPLVEAYPLREGLVARLMVALSGTGQQARALELYHRTWLRLRDELGLEPSGDLAAAQLTVLRQPAPAGTPAPACAHRPAQLPGDIRGFVGRRAILAQLDALLPTAGDGGAAAICAISGPAGVGKTALAIHWARRAARRFPDGQLYVDLRGFDRGGHRVGPGEALRGFLHALGTPPPRMPGTLAEQAALYRSLLAGRRVLVIVDNAAEPDQVRPLLPDEPRCQVVVTSRHRMTGLAVTGGAALLPLDLLSIGESRQLLAARIGRQRIVAEPEAVGEIVRRCARLPLALSVVAARIASTPQLPIAAHAAELSARRETLAELREPAPSIDVGAVFSWSYRMLPAAQARLLRLLSLHPGRDFSVGAAASLAGTDPDRLPPLLAGLTTAGLLVERGPGRFDLHDLLRAHAGDLSRELDGAPDREAARRRMLDHYLHTARAADRGLDPYQLARPLPAPPPAPGTTVLAVADRARARAWFSAERPVLAELVDLAADAGLDRCACQLASCLVTFLDRQGHWQDLARTQRVAYEAARRLGDPDAEASANRGLAIAGIWSGDVDAAERHFGRNLDLFAAAGDDLGRAHTHVGLGWARTHCDDLDGAVRHTRKALTLYRRVGSPSGQAKALNNLGWMDARRGEPTRALAHCERALALHRDGDDRHGLALTLDNIGFIRHGLGQYAQAVHCYRRAAALHRGLGDRYDEADVLAHLGDSLSALGEPAAAREVRQAALGVYQELDHPDASLLRDLIAATG